MNLRKLVMPLTLLTALSGCEITENPGTQKQIEDYKVERHIELNTYITGVVLAEDYTQEITKNPEHNGLFEHSNPTMTLGEDFYSIKIKTFENEIYSINILNGQNGATKKALNLLIDEGDTISFKATNRDIEVKSIWDKVEETNFYKNPKQQTGSKYASRINVISTK
jgi:hypothetical protein